MNIVIIVLEILVWFFAITFTIYYFNLDSKLLQNLYKPMMKRFDNMERDRKI